MENWTINEFARTQAQQLYEATEGGEPLHDKLRAFVVDDLVIKLKAHIKALAEVGFIHPRPPATNTLGLTLSVDETYVLTRRDSERVLNFIRLPHIDQVATLAKFEKRKAASRSTLEEAAGIIETRTTERFETLLEWLMEDARSGNLATYDAERDQSIKYNAARPPRMDDEARWKDLDKRLATTSFSFRFGLPAKERRRDELDPAIDKAIALAGTQDLKLVWLQLQALAQHKESPFTGILKGTFLAYTTSSKNEHDWFSKKALGQRIRRRAVDDTIAL